MPWWGDLISIPASFAYCDGTNGTPDLRGRTLIGTGTWLDAFGTVAYDLGSIGGNRVHQLSISEIPSHNHLDGLTSDILDSDDDLLKYGYVRTSTKGVLYVNASFVHQKIPYTSSTGGNQPHNNMQPYMAIHWIMKL